MARATILYRVRLAFHPQAPRIGGEKNPPGQVTSKRRVQGERYHLPRSQGGDTGGDEDRSIGPNGGSDGGEPAALGEAMGESSGGGRAPRVALVSAAM